ncbi:MAG TPA: M13 family metallopeptidase [Burkholderiaceae bacterium]|nr:M13 family metallopeptidase [Burkholderiaceae bacterium]
MSAAYAAGKPDFLTANVDASMNPGDDLYQYGNGGWIRRNPIPATEAHWGVSQLVRDELYQALRTIHEKAAATPAPAGSDTQKIGDFWRTAMDVQKARRLGIGPLRAELARIDAVQDLPQAIDAAVALQAIGVQPFFALFIRQDFKDSQIASLYAWQGGLGLPERDFYINDDPSIRDLRTAYIRYLARMLKLSGRREADVDASATAVMRLETALALVQRKLEATRDPLQNYHRFAPREFTRSHTPWLNWDERLAAWHVGPEFIVVGQPEYFGALDAILHRTPVAVLKDYLRLQLLTAYAEALSPEFERAHFDFYKRALSGQQVQRPRWKRIIDTESGFGPVPDSVGMIVGRRFVDEHFPERAKRRYVDMTRAVIEAYGERIRELTWMSEPTKSKALEKLATVSAKVGYPDRWNDHSALAIGRESHCQNMIAIERWSFQRSLARIGAAVDRSEWFMTPQTYNAYYNASNNEIVLPAAVFAIPGVADDDVDDAVAYAYAGASTIGHEITHGFDDSGRRFDAKGNLSDWWTSEDAAAFEQRAAVLVRQFDAYEPLPGFRVNGKASLGENIADLGGLAIALDAFKKTDQYYNNVIIAGQTPLQRFFLGYSLAWLDQSRNEQLRRRLLSDTHAPPKYRVLGPASNVQEFYDAFGVTAQRKMWRAPGERASVR